MQKLFLILCAISITVAGSAQVIKDPTDWKAEVKKGAAGHYTVTYHLILKPTWHLYAMQPGGDGTLIATRFSTEKKSGVKSVGAVTEGTKPTITTVEGVDGKVRLYTGKADFRQAVVGARGQSFTTVVDYQSCNDKMCLPPKKAQLTIVLP